MKRPSQFLPALVLLVLAASPAWAAIPQTITVDGANDFDPSNLIDADGGDTETKDWCTGTPGDESPMDLGNIYLTNDTNFLYFGFDYDRACFASPAVNLGIAIDVNTVAGGATDPFARKIAWNNIVKKPDWVVYDVVDSYNYEVLYQWSGSAWNATTSGPDQLGIADDTGFEEGKLSLATLGLAVGDTIHVEFWVTQDGTTKPPLDAGCSDDVQTSTPSGTTFDVSTAVEMSCMYTYVVQGASDTTPPTLVSATATGFALGGQKQFITSTNKIDVTFSEPVGAGATTPSNYAVSNTAASVTSAVVDGSDATKVHLTLSASISASASFYNVTVTNVQDLAGNPIVNDGTGNVRSFFLKRLLFQGNMSVYLLANGSPPDSFSVEGSLNPLTFTPLDNAQLLDPDVDSVYVTTVPMSVPKNVSTGKAEVSLEWKFYNNHAGFEPRSNRQHLVSSDNGAVDTLYAYWNDDEPSSITTHPIDVAFRVDATAFGPGATDTVAVTGNNAELTDFATPGIIMKDDGVGPDATAGDGLYAVYVRFPAGTYKNVEYKFTFNSVYECMGQGNRTVFLNDAAYDTVGGANGPLELPARGIDRCTVTDKDIKVIFRVDADYWFGGPINSVGVNGGVAPLNFNIPSESLMLDDGVAPDAAAGDDTFTVAVIFPDSSAFSVNYKYVINDTYECAGFGDRMLSLDDVNFSVANPQIPPVGIWDYCEDITTGVPGNEPPRPRVTIHLAQNYPNPFSPRTSIEFTAEKGGPATLTIYDVNGRQVRTLIAGNVDAGLHVVQWNGRDDLGRTVRPGVYFYSLQLAGEKATRRMVLMQ